MSLERAVDILTKAGVTNPEQDLDYFAQSESLSDLREIMIREDTYLGASQLMSNRLRPLFAGDLYFGQSVVNGGRQIFSKVPEQIVIEYLSEGGGVDISTAICSRMGVDLPVMVGRDYTEFSNAADSYLFDALKMYIGKSRDEVL